jgi:Tc toxin complex TcA C-terminal TcB-binding domain/Neuraminidase-like domain/Salmonella virulence plasmid 28.1kDa A protein
MMAKLTPQQLLALDQLRDTPLAEVRQSNPDLFPALDAKAAQQRKETISTAFTAASADLRAAVSRLDYRLGEDPARSLPDVVLTGLAEQRVSEEVARDAADRLMELESSSALADPAASHVAIGAHPLFAGELQQATVMKIVLAASLDEEQAGKVIDTIPVTDRMDDAGLTDLITKGVVQHSEADTVGLTATLFHLAGDSVKAAEGLRAGLAEQGTSGAGQFTALAGLGERGWLATIEAGGVEPPETMTTEEFAAQLDRTMSGLFPTDAMMAKVLDVPDPEILARDIALIEPVLADTTDRSLTALEVPAVNEIAAARDELLAVANMHPGLRLSEVIESEAAASDKAKTVRARLGLLRETYERNPSVELLTVDYTPESTELASVDFGDLGPDEQRMVVEDLKTHQRVFAMTDDVDHAHRILKAGYHSSVTVAAGSRKKFQEATGLADDEADRYYKTARTTIGELSPSVLAIADIFRGGFDDLAMANVDPDIKDFLRKLPGFAELFGSQDYCECPHCQSILSPAAYFVDLMSFVDEHVRELYFTGAAQGDVLDLKVRRPDLWTLPLTCANTDTLVRYLDIIDEVLENYLAERTGFGGDLTDRAAVEDFVYRQQLLPSVDSFAQPFVLPLEKLDAYLSHFGKGRGDVARIFTADPIAKVIARLGLSAKGYDLITTANTDLMFLNRIYGLTFTDPGTGVLDPVEAQSLLRPTGITRTELDELAASSFVTANGTQPIEIKGAKRSPDSVQNDIERITALRADSLDRAHRLVRLVRQLPWTIGELDLVLGQLAAEGLPGGLGEAMLAALADVRTLQDRFDIPVDQVCALWGPVPRRAVAAGEAALFDRVFNMPSFVLADGTLPNPAVSFVHPSLRTSGTPAPQDNTLHRLLAGLGVRDDSLAATIGALSTPLAANPQAPNEDDRGFALSDTNLTMIYRHALLTRLLKLDVPELFALIDRAGLPGGHVGDLASLQALLEFYDWWKPSRYSLDDLALITGAPVAASATYPDTDSVAAGIVNGVQADGDLLFADTVFAFVPGMTETDSRAVVAANSATIVATADGSAFRLSDSFDPSAALSIPAGIPAAELDLRTVLLSRHSSIVLPLRLAAGLGVAVEAMPELIAMTSASTSDAGLVAALHGGPIAPLTGLVGALVPLSVLFKNKAFDLDALAFVRTHPAVFGIDDFAAINVSTVRALSVYARFAEAGASSAFTPQHRPLDPADLRHCLATFDAGTKFAATEVAKLAAILRIDEPSVATLLPAIDLPDTAPEALARLGVAAALSAHLGIGADTLGLMSSVDYEELNRAAEAMLAAFRAKYPVEKDFLAIVEPYQDLIASRMRDGLADYLIRSIHPEFDTLDELYQHFLIDVQLDGVMRTSRLVAAISSVQLYVHRVRLNLEQDRRDPDDAERTVVPPGAIPGDEWEWRKNYRVWEANRKVFLWPENYLEPELRDDKTPLFTELESAVLQQRIDEQNVTDAYAAYLAGFDELSTLSLAGAVHDTDRASRSDVLHLFGVTPSDPPVYYHRTIINARYGETEPDRSVAPGPWQRIDVQIPMRKVAPVVHLGRLFVFWTEVVTTPKNKVSDGGSQFVGYKHRMTLKYTTLRLDGRWSPPQPITLSGGVFPTGEGIVDDPLSEQAEREAMSEALGKFDFSGYFKALQKTFTPRYDTKVHTEPLDGYTLSGFAWDRVYPDSQGSKLRVTGRNFQMRADIDFYRHGIESLSALHVRWQPTGPLISSRPIRASLHELGAVNPWIFAIDDHAHASILADGRRLDAVVRMPESAFIGHLITVSAGGFTPLGWLLTSPDTTVVNNSISDSVIDLNGDLLYLQGSTRPGPLYVAKRLGTTLGETMQRTLFTHGVDGLLQTTTQASLGERGPMALLNSKVESRMRLGKLDFTGGMGTYFREVFFHVPFLIADHLNGQQQFAEAQRWYHYLFDPTSAEVLAVPAGTPAAERERRQRDRVWRYSEFRGLGMTTLREILTDPKAIAVYESDPFNPHAIARLRLSAYQKCIVMRYVDNLLDWGDQLFTQFTMESVNEATQLYVMASDVLGPRPATVGTCGEGGVAPRNYATIGPLVKKGSEFLVELETLLWTYKPQRKVYGVDKRVVKFALAREDTNYFTARAVARRPLKSAVSVGDVEVSDRLTTIEESVAAAAMEHSNTALAEPSGHGGVARFTNWRTTHLGSWQGDKKATRVLDRKLITDVALMPQFGWGVIRQLTPVFGVPVNPELRGYWDRVEDRVYKLRHGMNIEGVRRQLALFAPEIDPRLLVRARAAGLSIADVLQSTSGDLPPYRFTYLIEKARQHAAMTRAFGAELQSALEKKDAEELARLRTVHQQNLLKLNTMVRDWEIEQARDALQSVARQQAGVKYRIDYFNGLLDRGLNGSENVQQIARHTASATYIGGALLHGTAGVLSLIPQLGSPFAMKYGGVELGSSAKAFGQMLLDTAKVAEVVASSAGLEAGFDRRREGWKHQRIVAEHEMKVLDKQQMIAETRLDIAQRSLELHQEQIAQTEEVFEFYGERFSNLALYSWLSSTLQRLHKDAFNSALTTARLAEQAYRFERADDVTPLLSGDYFNAERAGLLAGDRLMVELETMERRFIETNYRTPEIDQAFSLAQIDPAALVRLRETGECDFAVGEVFFDLFYPGHYRRRIRSVRLSIPCVTGPYTNVPATLTLTGSAVRRDPQLGAAALISVPPRRSVSVATSTGQNDAGVFEFSFRDERYMPFEGAGAVSQWKLQLPSNFRPFDYQTITDVILHVDYTAQADGVLRSQVEDVNAALDGSIIHYLTNNEMPRVYSLRMEFSTAFDRLLHSATGTAVPVEITDRHLPVFLRSRDVVVTSAKVLLRTAKDQTVAGVTLSIGGTAAAAFAADPTLGGMAAADVTTAFAGGVLGEHRLTVINGGDLTPGAPEPGDPSAVDADKLLDVLLYLELRLS